MLRLVIVALLIHAVLAVKLSAVCETVQNNEGGSCVPQTFRLVHQKVKGAPAHAQWQDTIQTTGTATLIVTTDSSYSNMDQMRAAGIVEGYLTQQRIAQHIQNLFDSQFGLGSNQPSTSFSDVTAFIQSNVKWVQAQIAANAASVFWQTVALTMAQAEGIVQGYNMKLKEKSWENGNTNNNAAGQEKQQMDPPLDLVTLILWNSIGDIDDIQASIYPAQQTNCWDMNLKDAMEKVLSQTHCTVLIKPIKNEQGIMDVGMSHISWFDFRGMMRIWKTYNFGLARSLLYANGTQVSTNKPFAVMMSGYPALLSSFDDYYVIADRQLIITETTNDICNGTLYTTIKPQSLMAWQRTIVANILAADGQAWTSVFSQANSGTYNNQFMILDTRLIQTGSTSFAPNTLWIVEQAPGSTASQDVTSYLNTRGYWASYNRPYFSQYYTGMGYAKSAQVHGDFFTYDHCARANIFARDVGKVVDIPSFKLFMQYNDWENDPLSVGNPYNAIAARGDLVPSDGHWPSPWLDRHPDGGTDCKFATAAWTKSTTVRADMISGPSHLIQPVWDWRNPLWVNYSHIGHPDVFDFPWQTYTMKSVV